ncbi:hypothetical protein SISNIDRAFT_495575 [Sistotremastrum niveocremeum HHB9708]|uniref:Uncharacterized protein n=1 Tax=Sistotremastrum niveocremeum HHB9708 TaxID=1314777 RepID=A0A164URB4_9AGAM|nr:hypothetical protein SISNIDRAFT_495575 [Sistotremastrum niveocremeum HHB9708]
MQNQEGPTLLCIGSAVNVEQKVVQLPVGAEIMEVPEASLLQVLLTGLTTTTSDDPALLSKILHGNAMGLIAVLCSFKGSIRSGSSKHERRQFILSSVTVVNELGCIGLVGGGDVEPVVVYEQAFSSSSMTLQGRRRIRQSRGLETMRAMHARIQWDLAWACKTSPGTPLVQSEA